MTLASPPAERNTHLRFWLIVGALFAAVLFFLSDALLPFVLGFAIAYFLDPVVSRMSRLGVPRWASALSVLLIFIAVLTGVAVIVVPIIRIQVEDLVASLPGYIDTLQNNVLPRLKGLIAKFPSVDAEKVQAGVTQYSGDILGFIGTFLGGILVGGQAVLGIVTLFILTPVIAFFLLRDWPAIVASIDGLLPLQYAPIIRQQLYAIDRMIAGFVRGQALVSLGLAVFYSVGLSLAGLKYGMLIGLGTGLLSFIPIVGTIVGLAASMTMALIQFDSINSIAAVALVFALAQMLDGYFLTPKLVGDSVGLHPVWIMFAVLAGGKLFGFVGILLGVPLVGTIAILLRFALSQYRNSRYFRAAAPPPS